MEPLAKGEQGLNGGGELTSIINNLRRKAPTIFIDKMFSIIVFGYSVWSTNENSLINCEFGNTI